MGIDYIIIAFLGLIAALFKNIFTEHGMIWRDSLLLPSWAPLGSVLGSLSGAVFILFVVAVILLWKESRKNKRHVYPVELFGSGIYLIYVLAFMAVLDIFQSYLFFMLHALSLSLAVRISIVILGLTVSFAALKLSRISSYFLLIYTGWMIFLSYMAYAIITLNAT